MQAFDTCKTCKWWVGETIGNMRRCDAPHVIEYSENGDSDVSAYMGVIHTGHEFGCIHHEKRET